jgi:trypsin-like peptidase
VTAELLKNGGIPQARFGFVKNIDGPGANNGRVVKMAGQHWELISNPPEGLDFSLLRLAENAGDDVMASNRSRGWLTPKDHDFVKDEPMLILQHPEVGPMKVSGGYLRDKNDFLKRIGYTVNTKGGSSGSPCFTLGWDLVAIHHHGDGFTNHGVPMKYILNFLDATEMPINLF